jgi:DNA-binding NarL/FixJ family response regulator
MGGMKTKAFGQTPEARDMRRDQIDSLRSRLDLLGGRDKVLMTLYIENGSSFRQIARLRGVSETSVARRIHQLTRRLTDGDFLRCVRNRDKLSRRQMTIARDALLTGLSLRQIAGKRGMSMYAVRKELAEIRRLIRKTRSVSNRF